MSERFVRVGGKLVASVFSAAVEGLVKGVIDCVGIKSIDLMIVNDWSLIEVVLNAIYRKPEYPPELSEEEVSRLEELRKQVGVFVLPLLGMARMIASKMPEEYIVERLDGGWLMRRIDEKFPELSDEIRKHGARGEEWVDRQARQIAYFFTGKLRYNPREGRIVEA